MTAAGPLLSVRDVGVRIGGASLLRGVSLTVEEGQLMALVGPNGAGKSTLLRVLAGELTPADGAADFAGKPICRWPAQALARRRAVVTQHADRDCLLTARQIIELGRLPWGRPARDKAGAAAVAEAIATTGVDRFADRPFSALSGGERQRVHLARALAQIHGPEGYSGCLLLLDEPTAHMDIAAQLASLGLVAALVRSGLTAVVAVHDLAAASIADRVCVLRGGQGLIVDHPSRALTPAMIDAAFEVRAETFVARSGAAAFAFSL